MNNLCAGYRKEWYPEFDILGGPVVFSSHGRVYHLKESGDVDSRCSWEPGYESPNTFSIMLEDASTIDPYHYGSIRYSVIELDKDYLSLGSSDGKTLFFSTTKKTYEDLSIGGTANCYIVSKAGSYKFNATVKGVSDESVGTPVTAEVLWESFGTDVTPGVGDIVTGVRLDQGYVTFSTPSPLNDGNAVIAVKDASGNIIWSWHIWVCNGFDAVASAHVYNNDAGTLMDRNLGATSCAKGEVRSLGLIYQWGRKDPFLASSSIELIIEAASTAEWPQAEEPFTHLSGGNTIEYATSHPMTFISNIYSAPYDWYCASEENQDRKLWSSEKTKYDPCPQGWKVPDYYVWAIAFNSYESDNCPWDQANEGADFGSANGHSSSEQLGSADVIWYPAIYRISEFSSPGYHGFYWSNETYGTASFFLSFSYEGEVYSICVNSRSFGSSVRCMKE